MEISMAAEVEDTDCLSKEKSANTQHTPIPTQTLTKPSFAESIESHMILNVNRGMQHEKPQRSLSAIGVLQSEIDQVKALVQTEPHGCDLRMLLFTVAASSDRYESTLVPLPPQFRAAAGAGCQVERLRRAITNNWPRCRVIPKMFYNKEEVVGLGSDDMDAWRLLHWLLTAHPAYPSFRRLSVLHLNLLCRIMGLARPTQEPHELISIGYYDSNPQECKWRQNTNESRNYAFLGLPLNQVYRFLYTGRLDIPPGEPIRLYLQLEQALVHCLEPERQPLQQQQEKQEQQQQEQVKQEQHQQEKQEQQEQENQEQQQQEHEKQEQQQENQEQQQQEKQEQQQQGQKQEEKEERQQEQQQKPQEKEQKEQQEQEKTSEPVKMCWPNSILARTGQRALLICELPADLDEPKACSPDQHFLEFLVQESTSLKPCYLLMYDEPVAAKMMLNWPGNPIDVPTPTEPSLMQRSSRRLSKIASSMNGRLSALRRLLSSL